MFYNKEDGSLRFNYDEIEAIEITDSRVNVHLEADTISINTGSTIWYDMYNIIVYLHR